MYGVGEGGTGAIQGKGRGKRGQSQSEQSEDSEDEDRGGAQKKRVCTGAEGGGREEGSDSKGDEGWNGTWLRAEMEGLEERGEMGQT